MHLPTTTYVPYEFNDKVKGDRSVPEGTAITELLYVGAACWRGQSNGEPLQGVGKRRTLCILTYGTGRYLRVCELLYLQNLWSW